MSKEIHTAKLTIVRSTHLARDAVLFALWGVAAVEFHGNPFQAYELLLWFILDVFGLLFLWFPGETWQKVGVGWGGLMSLVLLIPVVYYFFNELLIMGLIMILLLCIIELLVVLKIIYDVIKAEARSWTESTETPT